MRQYRIRLATILFGGVLSTGCLPAQAPAPQEFGRDGEAIFIAGSSRFLTANGGSLGASGDLRWATNGGLLRFPLDSLPNGARITRTTYYFHDTDPASDVRLIFCWSWFEADRGAPGCPDAPLTRGQMAVFLAKALGLQWPWNAP